MESTKNNIFQPSYQILILCIISFKIFMQIGNLLLYEHQVSAQMNLTAAELRGIGGLGNMIIPTNPALSRN